MHKKVEITGVGAQPIILSGEYEQPNEFPYSFSPRKDEQGVPRDPDANNFMVVFCDFEEWIKDECREYWQAKSIVISGTAWLFECSFKDKDDADAFERHFNIKPDNE